MRLPSEFVRLPLRFDAERLAAEIAALGEAPWRPHPQGHFGNSALPLIARGGDPLDDGVKGAMLPTPELGALDYTRQVLDAFSTVLGRTRLMRIDAGASATRHVDTNHYWAERVRIHVPVVTDPRIRFLCGEHEVSMGPGEAWIFDAWLPHDVLNPTDMRRIHLVADSTGSPEFWDLVRRGSRVGSSPSHGEAERAVVFEPGADPMIATERISSSVVMTPWEQVVRRDELLAELHQEADPETVDRFTAALRDLGFAWRQAWSQHGDAESGWPVYDALVAQAEARIVPVEGRLRLRNGSDAVGIARQRLLRPARDPDAVGPSHPAPPTQAAAAGATEPARPAASTPDADPPASPARRRATTGTPWDRPVFIVGAPRSRTSMVFEALATSPDAWTLGGESHAVIESVPGLSPAQRGWDSNRLEAIDATPARVDALGDGFLTALRDAGGAPPPTGAERLRLVEKTPKNALRVPFLAAAFPDALFVHVHRDFEPTVASMVEAWRSGRFVTYPQLPDWTGEPWSLLLTPGWRALDGRPVVEVAGAQWAKTVATLLDDLERLEPSRVLSVDADAFGADPPAQVARVCAFAGLTVPADVPSALPPSRHTLTPPAPEKWRTHEVALDALRDRLVPLSDRSRARVAAAPVVRRVEPLGSLSTGSVAEVLDDLGCALAVSTYQAGKLMVLRAAGDRLNAHFRGLERPMGIAHDGGARLAVGTQWGLVEYRDIPEAAQRLAAPIAAHDACFIPRRSTVTGDVRVHDVAFVGDELWFVATAFSCLATLDADHSFVPRWQPAFVSELVAEDRCHLNGMAVVGDEVRYVTALGRTDTRFGWREHKADGGVIIDVGSDATVVSGLSMPHSPRWHDERLWVLESGRGTLSVVDLDAGTTETVVELPGFTRGLAFAGPYAFVGLSQIREATTFGGLPLTARGDDLRCGVWVVDRRSGSVAGFVEFQDAVQEIFDVVQLPRRFPEIADRDGDAALQTFVLPAAASAAAP